MFDWGGAIVDLVIKRAHTYTSVQGTSTDDVATDLYIKYAYTYTYTHVNERFIVDFAMHVCNGDLSYNLQRVLSIQIYICVREIDHRVCN